MVAAIDGVQLGQMGVKVATLQLIACRGPVLVSDYALIYLVHYLGWNYVKVAAYLSPYLRALNSPGPKS